MSDELETQNAETEDASTHELEARSASAKNLEVVLDIPVRLSMEVGNTKISIRKLLQLNKGSIVELTRTAGEPLDVLVNDKFGVRLLDVISPEQRIASIN